MTVFRKVSVKERLPETEESVFIGHDEDDWISSGYHEGGIWFNDFDDDCPCYPEYWLEEVPVPSIVEINAEADRQFPAGRSAEADGFKRGGQWMFNRILRKLI